MSKRFTALGLFTVGAVVMLVFQPALSSGLYSDDWRFVRIAGMSVLENLSIYFDPRRQFQWYRPIQGMQYLLGYHLFGANVTLVHLARILFHLASSGLLFLLVKDISGKWRIGLVAALIFAVTHGDARAVIWLAEASVFQVFFFLLALWLWWRFLQNESRTLYWLTFGVFILALLSKEASASLPVLFFLMEYLLKRKEFKWRAALRRYAPIAAVLIVYMLIEIYIRLYGTPDPLFQTYKPGTHILVFLVYYLTLVVFPWGLPYPFSHALLVLATGVSAYLIIFKKNRQVLFLMIGTVLAILPVTPFGGIIPRYFYLPSVFSAVLLAMVTEYLGGVLARYRFQWILAGVVAGVLIFGGLQVADTVLQFRGLGSVDRAALRAITAVHPKLPTDTDVYFIEPLEDVRDLNGMLFVRYGAGVQARRAERNAHLRMREQPGTLVVYRNDILEYRVVEVESADSTSVTPALPLDFEDGIRLTSYELARSTLKRGEPIVLFFNWEAVRTVPRDYVVFVHLVDQTGNVVDGHDSEPCEARAPTSRWLPGEVVFDWIVFPVPTDAPAGDYNLEIGWYHAPTMQRLAVLDADGNPVGDKLTIGPLRILP